MFDAEEGNTDSALDILDRWLLPSSATSPLDACDATALLNRLATDGVNDRDRWRELSNAFGENMTPGFWPHVDLHAAFAHLQAAEPTRMRALSQSIHRCAQGSDYAALRARHITLPGLRVLTACSQGRHGEATGLLADLRPVLSDVGGSRVQLDIFRNIERQSVRARIAPERTPWVANTTYVGKSLADALPT